MYKFIVARNVSDIADPERTLGIEITDPAVALACGLGNVDPQHGCGSIAWQIEDRDGGSRWPMAAIEQYYGLLRCSSRLPPEGSTLATTRSDADSVGAMAVIVAERLVTTNEKFAKAWHTDGVRARIEQVAHADSFRVGRWAPSRLPTEDAPWATGPQPVDSTRSIAHVGSICAPPFGGPAMPLAERVAVTLLWLLLGDDPTTLLDGDVYDCICGACGVDVSDYYVRLSTARRAVDESRLALAREAQRPGAVEVIGAQGVRSEDDEERGTSSLAIVRVSHAGALGLGYCAAPVVIAFDEGVRHEWIVERWDGQSWRAQVHHYDTEPAAIAARVGLERCDRVECGLVDTYRVTRLNRKVTIAEYNDDGGRVDWAGLRAALNRAEVAAGGEGAWGGPRNLLGSPQRGGTRLTDDAVIALVRAHMTAR